MKDVHPEEGAKYDYGTATGAAYLLSMLFLKLQAQFDRVGGIDLEVVMLARFNPETEKPFKTVLALGISCPALEKEDFSTFLRLQANRLGAVGVILASEAWIAMPEVGPGHPKFPTRVEEVKELPGAMDAVCVTLEHKELGRKFWVAPINQEDGKRYLGEFMELPVQVSYGMFANILPQNYMN